MDWEQKFLALNAMAPMNLRCRGTSDWYVEQSVEVKSGSILRGSYGNGPTPMKVLFDYIQSLAPKTDMPDLESALDRISERLKVADQLGRSTEHRKR